jgi:hypothetical protein
MRLLFTLALVLLTAANAAAQTPVTKSKGLSWRHSGVDVDRFRIGVDGVYTDVEGGATARSVRLPAMTVGTHTLTLQACFDTECAASAPLMVRLVIVEAPTDIAIVDVPQQ